MLIQTIFLSSAIAFSVKGPDIESPCDAVTELASCTKIERADINCMAFEEVQGWEWGKFKDETYAGCKCNTDCGNIVIACPKEQKILWRKLIGTCDDGVMRWQEQKP